MERVHLRHGMTGMTWDYHGLWTQNIYPESTLFILLYPSLSRFIPLYPSLSLFIPLSPSLTTLLQRAIGGITSQKAGSGAPKNDVGMCRMCWLCWLCQVCALYCFFGLLCCLCLVNMFLPFFSCIVTLCNTLGPLGVRITSVAFMWLGRRRFPP